MNRRILFLVPLYAFWLASAFCNTFYIDPVSGNNNADGTKEDPWKTLEYITTQPYIQSYSYVRPYDPKNPQLVVKNTGAPIHPGDTIVLLSGQHGSLVMTGFVNPQPIIIMAKEGHTPILKNIHLRACKNWVFDGLTVSGEPYREKVENLVFFESHSWQGPISSITFKNCTVYSALKPWTTADEWNQYMGNGIRIKGDSVLVQNNTFKNINFGITATGYHIRAIGNEITNFAGDGIRALTTRGTFKNNLIRNCYKVNNNHDDGIQSYTTGGLSVDSNIISGNIILNYTDPDQPLLGPLQGIGCFDGPYRDWIVENNVVIVEHWHGISLYGAYRCSIINNTVIDPTPGVKPGPCWIKIESHKNGTASSDCIVKNNISNTLSIKAKNTLVDHNQLFSSRKQYQSNFVDFPSFDLHLTKNSICVDRADDGFAPDQDLDDTTRPQGQHADIGAYEYVTTTRVSKTPSPTFRLSPNPATSLLHIEGSINGPVNVYIWSSSGQLLRSRKDQYLPTNMHIADLPNGAYLLLVDQKEKAFFRVLPFIKK